MLPHPRSTLFPYTTLFRSLHSVSSLVPSKLAKYGKLSNGELIGSLQPGQSGSLKVRSDGTIVDGHHRIKILRDRGVDVDSLRSEEHTSELQSRGHLVCRLL